MPVRLHLSVQGRGDPDGAWVLAGGSQIGPLALSGAAARGVPGALQLHVFGRRVWQRSFAALLERKDEGDAKEAQERPTPSHQRAIAGYRRFERWFDPVDFALFILSERRRIRVEQLDFDLDYSFVDIVTTGKLLGALYALGGALPPPIAIRPRPSWDSVDQAELAVIACVRLRPGLLALDSLRYVLRHVKILKRRPAARGATEAS